MKFMCCTTCKRVVQINCTGICLSCQKGFSIWGAQDSYLCHKKSTINLKEKLEKIEELIQESCEGE